MNRKTVAIILMIFGVAIVLGVILFALDKATSAEPDGLGTWIFTVLGLVLGASAGLKGWIDWNKKETPSQATTTTISAGDNSNAVGNITIGGSVSGDLIIGNQKPTAEITAHTLHQLPQPPADFTGREELRDQLRKDLKSSTGAMITGMGGMGKTALGLVVAHKAAKEYPDAQIFLDLKGTSTPLSALDIMRHVILSLEPNKSLQELDEKGITDRYHSVLHGRQVLLFLDNASSADQIEPVRPPETCTVIATSRLVFKVPGFSSHRIENMSMEDAKNFLVKLCPRLQAYAGEFARACAYLPLALRIAGSFLDVNDHWDIKAYLDRLKEQTKGLTVLEESRAQVNLSQEHPYLLATFDLSYHQLPEDDQKRWRVLGVFPASFDLAAVKAVWGLEEEMALKLLGLLRRYSLLDYNDAASRYSLHDLLVSYALLKIDDQEEVNARIEHAKHYSHVLENINQVYQRGGENILPALQLYDTERTNIEQGQRTSSLYVEINQEAAYTCSWYAQQSSINFLRLDPEHRIIWSMDGIRAARVLGNKQAEAAQLYSLASAYRIISYARQAIETYEQALFIYQEMNDRSGEAITLSGLGQAYTERGDPQKAIEYFEQALEINREMGNPQIEASDLINLGFAYYELRDVRMTARKSELRKGFLHNLRDAYKNMRLMLRVIENYEQALAIKQEFGDRHSEAIIYTNLGNAYLKSNLIRRAMKYHEKALAIYRELGDHHGEGGTLVDIGIDYFTLRNARKSIEFYTEALVILHKYGYRRFEANALTNMAYAYYSLKDKDKAIDFLKQALVIFDSMDSPSAEDIRNTLKKWGVASKMDNE